MSELNIRYSDKGERCVLDVHKPSGDFSDVLVYFHGGGLESGDKRWHPETIARLTECGICVVMPNYRLYPNAKYPEFIEDAAEAVAWAGKSFEGKRIFVGGSSAGAYLTAMLAYNKKYLGAHGSKPCEIAGFVINSSQMTTHFNVLRERGVNPKRIVADEAAPVFHLDEGMDFPRVLILAADNDMTCRLEQTRILLKSLEHMGCPEERRKFILMENEEHCSYDCKEIYAKILTEFILNNR